MNKKNNNSPYYKDWTDKKLKEELQNYIYADDEVNDYQDCIILSGINKELERRDISYYIKKEIIFN